MTLSVSSRFARHAVAAYTLGLVALVAAPHVDAASLSKDARRQILGEGKKQLHKRHAELSDEVKIAKTASDAVVTALKGKGAGAVKLTFSKAGSKRLLLLRAPGRGASWGGDANDAVAILAAQLGAPEWIPAGIVVAPGTFGHLAGVNVDNGKKKAEDKGKVMVTEFVPGYKDGEDAPIGWLKKIPEAKRLRAAVLDALSTSRDRKLANVMVNEEGDMRLIDHDVTFGQKDERGNHFASAFWKGEALSYKSKQGKFSDLPEDVQHLVTTIAEEEDLGVLHETYPINKSDRLPRLKLMAQRIIAHGLDAATKMLVDDSQGKGFLVSDYAPNAVSLRGN